MKLVPEIVNFTPELTKWRRDFHAHPELGFEEIRTSGIVAERLESFGIEVHRGLAGTGVVGTLKSGSSKRRIGLRADMDALPMTEANTFAHASKTPGVFHGCGHDGHTTMLLGAAKHLAETRNFDGTVDFIFQPAEEVLNGALKMVKDGLFDQFPATEIYGMHNFPTVEVGKIQTCVGAIAAAMDVFEVTVKGQGGHGGLPHLARSPMLAACKMVSALYEFTTFQISPTQPITLSVCQFHSGDSDNVIDEKVTFSGTVRALNEEARQQMEEAFPRIAKGMALAYGVDVAVAYRTNYPILVNTAAQTKKALQAARETVGAANVDGEMLPMTGSEDFAWMLGERPGSFVVLGNGVGAEGGTMVHNPGYDFNDAALPVGASYWVRLVESLLPKGD